MKRPYIPLSVRLEVIERQAFIEREFASENERRLSRRWYDFCCRKHNTGRKVRWLLELLFRGEPVELDHDPALELRKRRRNGDYIPDANDPRYLLYRLKPRHLQKTTGRAPGAERTVTSKGSDTWLAKKFRKLEHPTKVKARIASRPFPKGKRPFPQQRSSFVTRAARDS